MVWERQAALEDPRHKDLVHLQPSGFHPGAVLYEDVHLAEGCEIHANAVLHPGSRLGRGCVVQSNAVIGAEGFGFVPTAAGWRKMPQTGLVVLEDGVDGVVGQPVGRCQVAERGPVAAGDARKPGSASILS